MPQPNPVISGAMQEALALLLEAQIEIERARLEACIVLDNDIRHACEWGTSQARVVASRLAHALAAHERAGVSTPTEQTAPEENPIEQ